MCLVPLKVDRDYIECVVASAHRLIPYTIPDSCVIFFLVSFYETSCCNLLYLVIPKCQLMYVLFHASISKTVLQMTVLSLDALLFRKIRLYDKNSKINLPWFR
jgi:hypothetical protein